MEHKTVTHINLINCMTKLIINHPCLQKLSDGKRANVGPILQLFEGGGVVYVLFYI